MFLVNNEVLKLIRLLAINNVTSSTIEWYIEQSYRYYSKTYHTPLHVAKQILTAPEVVKIFMEDEMEDMPAEDIVAMRDRLMVSPKPMLSVEDYATEEDEEMSDEEWVLQQMAQAAEQEKNPTKKTKSSAGPSMADAAMNAQKAIQSLYNNLNKQVPEDLEGTINFDKDKKE
jgi:Ser-tRNA(Ala) deacylase AlaX